MEALLLDLILTIFGYMLVPVIIIIRGKKYPLKKLKTIAIVNGLVVWFIFTIIIINAGGESANASVILYSLIGYWLMKKKCLEEEKKEDIPQQ